MNRQWLSVSGPFVVLVGVIWLTPIPAAQQATGAAVKPAPAQQAKPWSHPKTPWGHPDLQALWNNDAENAVPLEVQAAPPPAPRPAAGAAATIGGGGPAHWGEGVRGGEDAPSARRSLIVDPPDGKLPPQTQGAKDRAAAKATAQRAPGLAGTLARFHAWDYCITRGVPDAMLPRLYGNNYEFVQTPNHVAIFHEMIHETRIIPLNMQPHLPDTVRLWLGDSRGHWEGSTLVVETKNFNGKTENNLIGHPGAGTYRGVTDAVTLVERFTRTGPDTMEYQFTLNDPKLYTRPWTALLNLTTKNSPDRIFEYACHEGNYSIANSITGAVVEEAKAQQAR